MRLRVWLLDNLVEIHYRNQENNLLFFCQYDEKQIVDPILWMSLFYYFTCFVLHLFLKIKD